MSDREVRPFRELHLHTRSKIPRPYIFLRISLSSVTCFFIGPRFPLRPGLAAAASLCISQPRLQGLTRSLPQQLGKALQQRGSLFDLLIKGFELAGPQRYPHVLPVLCSAQEISGVAHCLVWGQGCGLAPPRLRLPAREPAGWLEGQPSEAASTASLRFMSRWKRSATWMLQ